MATVADVEWDDYLRESAIPAELLDGLVAGEGWAAFDPELGYVNRSVAVDWGIDGSHTIQTYTAGGARTGFMYAGRRPRVACYGESVVQSQQVSDGETWEEYLAGHLGEPVANFGVGGTGLYQAFRRMVREESRGRGSSLVILGVDADSGVRSVLPALWPAYHRIWPGFAPDLPLFHGNLWPHLELDLAVGRLRGRENPLRTPEALRRMSDPEWMRRALRRDLPLRLHAVAHGIVDDLDATATVRLAALLGTDFRPEEGIRSEAARLLRALGHAAAIHVLDRAIAFTRGSGARLLVLLTFAGPHAESPHAALRRHLGARDVPFVDMNDVHRREHARFPVPYAEYLADFFVGHRPIAGQYNARGNHLLAYSMKDAVVALLGEKPLPYRRPQSGSVDLAAYRLLGLVGERLAARAGTDEALAAASRLGPVLRALDARLAEPWDVEAMADLAGLSRSALHRRFLETLGMTPMEYLKELRLDEAARRLVQTDATLDRVAADVGFANRFHLSREFARRFGAPPSRFRRDPGVHRSATPRHPRSSERVPIVGD